MTRATVFGINIVLETDDPRLIKSFLEFTITDRIFNFKTKKMGYGKVHKKIYNRTKKNPAAGTQYYEIGIGWAAWIIAVFGPYLPATDVEAIKQAIYSPTYRTLPFQELRDYQNSDVLHLLKYQYGLCTVMTSYGKTQVIACLAKYFSEDLGLNVLLVTPGTKAQDELVKRLKGLYGIEVTPLVCAAKTKKALKAAQSSKIRAAMTQGFLAQNALKDPASEALLIQELQSFDVVLSDEVEYCINPAGDYIFGNAENARYRYAFSGTADKNNGSMISFQNGLTDPAVSGNLGLIRFFGPSLVYRKPLDRNLELIDIQTNALYKANLSGIGKNLYLDVMTALFTCPDVCMLISEIIKRYKNLFIPINNLTSIIGTWIDQYWKGQFRVLLVCGEGYIYYDLQGNKTSLTLQEACDYIKNDMVDVIPSTAAGFRALDFPNLSNILVFSGKIAGSVLQQIGRVARQTDMTILTISPDGKKIPVYSKGCQERREMILEYYKYCKITERTIQDYELILQKP